MNELDVSLRYGMNTKLFLKVNFESGFWNNVESYSQEEEIELSTNMY